jgi:class 3 adenylate cyclase/tetratricopeptide (TPR) repeat protein
MVPCAACGGSNPEGFRFCGTCGATLAEQRAGRGTRKTVTVMFIDVAGSTELGERLDPEIVRRLMSRFYATSRAAIESHGGTVEKFIGDAVMAVFGIPDVHEDDAVRAVRTADEIRAAIEGLNADLRAGSDVSLEVRIGIDTGQVVSGDPQAGEGFATGEAVNIAQRLEATAAPGEILIGDRTLALVRHVVRSEPLAAVPVKGSKSPIQAHRLVDIETTPAVRPLRDMTPIVGRSAELATLQSELSNATTNRSARLVTVLGMAGVGKSRLVREFAAAVSRDVTLLRGRCVPYGEGITYWPLAELVRTAADIRKEDPPDLALAKLESIVASDPERDDVVSRIAGAVGLTNTNPAPDDVFWAVRRLLRSMAEARPLVVVFEDIHWAEETFLDLIGHVVRWIDDTAVLFLCLARPELLDRRPDWPTGPANRNIIELEPLEPVEAMEHAAQLLEGEVDASLLQRVVDAAEGNPLFTEELINMLVEGKQLDRNERGWRVADNVALELPDTIQALLAARLDQLPSEERAVAERASVIGRMFERSAVVEISPEAMKPSVGSHLRSLTRRQLVGPYEREDLYRFRHLLIRDAAYDSLPKEERAYLHERLADWLERRRTIPTLEAEELIGYHLEQAHRYRVELGYIDEISAALGRRAGEALAAAGRRAEARYDPRAALTLLTRANRMLSENDPLYWTNIASLGTAMAHSGRPREGLAMLDRALSELGSNDAVTVGRTRLHRRAVAATLIEPGVDHTRREVLSILCTLPHTPDADKLRAEICAYLGWAYRQAAQITRAERTLRCGVHYANRSGDQETQINCVVVLIDLGIRSTMPASEITRLCHAVLEMPALTRAQRAIVTGSLAFTDAMSGHLHGARRRIAEEAQILAALGFDTRWAQHALSAGLIEEMTGDAVLAEQYFRQHYDWRNAEGDRFPTEQLRFVAAHLARSLVAQGRLDEADEMVVHATESAGVPDTWTDTIADGAKARILALRGQTSEAVHLAEHVVARARSAGIDAIPLVYGGALEDLAFTLDVDAHPDAARKVLGDALELYARKEYAAGTARVNQALESLTAQP